MIPAEIVEETAADVIRLAGDGRAPRGWHDQWTGPRYFGFKPPCNFQRNLGRAMYLYVMQSGEFVKIGIADNVEKRHEQLVAGNPHGIAIRARRSMPRAVAKQVEQRLHAHFQAHAMGREWFRDLEVETILRAATPLVRHAWLAVQRWQDDGFFTWFVAEWREAPIEFDPPPADATA